jgi:hypothetical protein
MYDFEALRKRFKELMDAYEFNNSEMAAICEVSHVTIGNITEGRTKGFDVSIFTNFIKNKPQELRSPNFNYLLYGKGSLFLVDEVSQETKDRIEYLESQNEALESAMAIERIQKSKLMDKLVNMQGNLIAALDELNKLRGQK